MMSDIPYFVLITAITSHVYVCDECTDPSIEEKVYYSDVFAYGQVKELHQEDSRLSKVPDTHLVAEIELYCIFKGEPLPESINMSIPDYGSDPCVSYKFTKGNKYLLYLDTTDGVIRPSFNEDPASINLMDLISVMCDVTIDYPIGVAADNASETCPKPLEYYEYDYDCIEFDPDSDYNEDYADWLDDTTPGPDSNSISPDTAASVTMDIHVKSSAVVNVVSFYLTLSSIQCSLL